MPDQVRIASRLAYFHRATLTGVGAWLDWSAIPHYEAFDRPCSRGAVGGSSARRPRVRLQEDYRPAAVTKAATTARGDIAPRACQRRSAEGPSRRLDRLVHRRSGFADGSAVTYSEERRPERPQGHC